MDPFWGLEMARRGGDTCYPRVSLYPVRVNMCRYTTPKWAPFWGILTDTLNPGSRWLVGRNGVDSGGSRVKDGGGNGSVRGSVCVYIRIIRTDTSV